MEQRDDEGSKENTDEPPRVKLANEVTYKRFVART